MQKLNSLSQFKLRTGVPNFLIGLAGNGLSTKIQTEIYKQTPENVYYLNYINFVEADETTILLEFVNCILLSVLNERISRDDVEGIHTQFNIFKTTTEKLKQAEYEPTEIVIIFDEFQRLKNFSNAFFFTLDKILSISQVDHRIKLTSVLVSDEYIDPKSKSTSEGIAKLFFHYLNFDIIPATSFEEMLNNPISQNLLNLSKEEQQKIHKLSSGVISLLVSLFEIFPSKQTTREILNNYEIEWKLHEIWESIGKENQEVCKAIVQKKNIHLANPLQKNFLNKTGFIQIDQLKITSPLLAEYIKQQVDVELATKQESIRILNKEINLVNLTPQQEKLLRLLNNNRGKLVTREEIGDLLWGEKSIERYSDYAIDKLISQVRSIIPVTKNNVSPLVTKKGKGYILSPKQRTLPK